MGLSRRAYARHRGVSDMAVRKAIASGQIAVEDDGTIDTGKADSAWGSSFDPVVRMAGERILRLVVQPAVNFAFVDGTELLRGSAVRRKTIRHDRFCQTISSELFSFEFQCGFLVQPRGHEHLEHLALMVDGAPEGVLQAIDLHGDLIEMPAMASGMAPGSHPLPSDPCGKDRPEPDPPEPTCFKRNVDPSIVN